MIGCVLCINLLEISLSFWGQMGFENDDFLRKLSSQNSYILRSSQIIVWEMIGGVLQICNKLSEFSFSLFHKWGGKTTNENQVFSALCHVQQEILRLESRMTILKIIEQSKNDGYWDYLGALVHQNTQCILLSSPIYLDRTYVQQEYTLISFRDKDFNCLFKKTYFNNYEMRCGMTPERFPNTILNATCICCKNIYGIGYVIW